MKSKSYPKNRAERGSGREYIYRQKLIKGHADQFFSRCKSDAGFRMAVYAVLATRLATLKNKPVLSPEEGRERLRLRTASFRKRNLDLVRRLNRESARRRNKDGRTNAYMRKYLTDPVIRLKARIRCRVYDALKRQSASKDTRSWIGCSAEELVSHIESQFLPGMTWQNMGVGDGRWATDHVRPLASFDLSDPEQRLEAFHYKNLKPMWFKENCLKSSNYKGKKWFHSDHRKEVAA